MCGRYFLSDDSESLKAIIKAAEKDCSSHNQIYSAKTGEIFPSDIVPVLSMERKPTLMKWGFTKPFGKGLLINARSETIRTLSTFKSLIDKGRCLIPASLFYEWKTENAQKQKYSFSINEDLMYLAGLYRQEANMLLPCFVILTQASSLDVAEVHNRMPVIYKEENLCSWLTGGTVSFNNACCELLIKQAQS